MNAKHENYDYLVFVLRGQPFHYGHAKVITEGLVRAKKLIVLVGSANRARDWFNPFTAEERINVIREWADEEGIPADRITLLPLDDYLYNNNGWLTAVQHKVETIASTGGWTDYPPKIGLIGHDKDHTSYYLGQFPQWGNIDVGPFTDLALYNSTDVRTQYFAEHAEKMPIRAWNEMVEGLPNATHRFLRKFQKTEAFSHLYDEHKYINKYRRDHVYRDPKIRYVPLHTCVDACVIQSGHVLLVERKAHPGKGLLAMPGGFLNPNERLLDAMIRELREETKLKVAERTLRGSITAQDIFDEPHRSARGRLLSNTYRIELEPLAAGLPRVRGASDARKAMWVPLSQLKAQDFFEDHYFIIQNMVARPRR